MKPRFFAPRHYVFAAILYVVGEWNHWALRDWWKILLTAMGLSLISSIGRAFARAWRGHREEKRFRAEHREFYVK